MTPRDKKSFIAEMRRRNFNSQYINHSVCDKCKGRCCKDGGCQLMTCDVPEMTVQGIIQLLNTGKYSIVFAFYKFEVDEAIIMPTIQARELACGKVNKHVLRRPCSLQGANGCTFSDDDRPTGGILFAPGPSPNNNCKFLIDYETLVMDWLPQKQILDEVVLLETGKTTEELFVEGCEEDLEEILDTVAKGKELSSAESYACEILAAMGYIRVAYTD